MAVWRDIRGMEMKAKDLVRQWVVREGFNASLAFGGETAQWSLSVP